MTIVFTHEDLAAIDRFLRVADKAGIDTSQPFTVRPVTRTMMDLVQDGRVIRTIQRT